MTGARVDRGPHIDDGDLIRFFDGECSPEEAKQIRTHIDNCPECKGNSDTLKDAWAAFSSLLAELEPTAPLEVVGCNDEHFAEIYHRGVVNNGSYAEFQSAAAEECTAFFPTFVGISQPLSALASEAFTSSEEQWQDGARQFSCVLYLSSGDYLLVGSARDSWL